MDREIKEVKLYGGIGQILVLCSFLLPALKVISRFILDILNLPPINVLESLGLKSYLSLFLIGNILVITAVKKIFNIVSSQELLRKFLTSHLLALSLIVAFIFSIFIFLVLGFGGALSDQRPQNFNIVLLTIISFACIVFILIFYFYRRSLLIIYQATKNSLFKLSGNIILIGGLLTLLFTASFLMEFSWAIFTVMFGILVVFLGFLLSIIGFFNLKSLEKE